MKSTELIHEIVELCDLKDSRGLMNLLKSLRKITTYEITKELLNTTLSDVRLTDLPGKLYRRTYGTKLNNHEN